MRLVRVIVVWFSRLWALVVSINGEGEESEFCPFCISFLFFFLMSKRKRNNKNQQRLW
ncbi:hypothetical protein GLYMA_16G181850v4 [Glycine max]|nr:hypothetical protein GLYMA_16G181850v4 [Glycine max]